MQRKQSGAINLALPCDLNHTLQFSCIVFLNVSDRMGEVEALAYELDEYETVVTSNGEDREHGNKQRSIYGKMFLKLHYIMPPHTPAPCPKVKNTKQKII